jgi:hypothetical protein
MKIGFFLGLLLSLGAVPSFISQSVGSSPTKGDLRVRARIVAGAPQPTPAPTPSRVVVTDKLPKPTKIAQQPIMPDPTPTPVKVVVTNNLPAATKIVQPTPPPTQTLATEPQTAAGTPAPYIDANNLPLVNLSFGEIKSRIAEARRQMQAKPILISSPDPKLQTGWVRIAFMDPRSSRIDFVSLNKDSYLKTGAVNQAASTDGRTITVRTIRANGVNTPIQVVDSNGVAQLPLMVQYPVEKGGRYIETAYYMSTHPGLVTPEVVNAGKLYVHNVIEIARDRLRQKGITVQPGVADIAERLATVEHVDHDRFHKEVPKNIFDDVFTLYALNEGQTFRYSVSSAGAGGMVQMIPSTYAMIRSHYPNVGLMPDFVEGMRNHVNATQAMLLYMQMTWNDIASNSAVSNAMASGIATQKQLMAAGYNSNPSKLGGYIDRGGSSWTNLIPRETQLYLQIYDALERSVPMTPRTH